MTNHARSTSMRLLVATDTIGPLSSAHAGRVIAEGWPGMDVRVLPIGTAGAGFLTAYAEQLGAVIEPAMAGELLVRTATTADEAAVGVAGAQRHTGLPTEASSAALGQAVLAALDPRPNRLVLDLAGLDVHDGGAGLLGALGATADRPLDRGVAGLAGIGALDLGPARAALSGTELVGVVPADQLSQPLLGLRGITSLRGRATETDPALLLSTDATLAALAELTGAGQGQQPGAGACGGLGLAVLALGGRLSTGPELALASSPAPTPLDLVVTGTTVFDFATRGGGVVAAAASVAVEALSPCIVLAGEVLIGGREMRTMGIEAAYGMRPDGSGDDAGGLLETPEAVVEAELAALAARVARSWRW